MINQQLNRRAFLKMLSCTAACMCLPDIAMSLEVNLQEALYYKKLADNKTECLRCPRGCVLSHKERGFCRIRENQNGTLYTLTYNYPCAVHIDPIEKKPLFHVLPASTSFSLATAGCNLRCKFCQNWQISQAKPEEVEAIFLDAKTAAAEALKNNCKTVAYTYTEPTTFIEYAIDCAKEAKALGLKNVMHSNGYCNPEPLKELLNHLDAVNVDLKSFDKKFYAQVCEGSLDTVLESLKIIKQAGVWLEITNLVIPTLNDNMQDIKQMCLWIKNNLGADVPLHFSRFYPMYKLLNMTPTSVSTLEQARETALASGLKFVYIGNITGNRAEHTYCPSCKQILIERAGYAVLQNKITNSQCPKCRTQIPGIWS